MNGEWPAALIVITGGSDLSASCDDIVSFPVIGILLWFDLRRGHLLAQG
jgi:hypothetical protein